MGIIPRVKKDLHNTGTVCETFDVLIKVAGFPMGTRVNKVHAISAFADGGARFKDTYLLLKFRQHLLWEKNTKEGKMMLLEVI